MLFRQLSEYMVADTVVYNLPKSSLEGRYDSVVSTPFLSEEGRQCDSALICDCSPPLVTMVFLTQKYLDLNRWSWEDPKYFGGL